MSGSKGRWQRQGLIPTSRHSPEEHVLEPIHAALIDDWRSRGKTLPGRPDQEWNRIVSRDPWPRDTRHGRAAGREDGSAG